MSQKAGRPAHPHPLHAPPTVPAPEAWRPTPSSQCHCDHLTREGYESDEPDRTKDDLFYMTGHGTNIYRELPEPLHEINHDGVDPLPLTHRASRMSVPESLTAPLPETLAGHGRGRPQSAAGARAQGSRLRARRALLIFPEGVSQSEPRLMPLRTGAARLVLDAAAEIDQAVTVLPSAWSRGSGHLTGPVGRRSASPSPSRHRGVRTDAVFSVLPEKSPPDHTGMLAERPRERAAFPDFPA